ncbi:hypothetical protein RYX36_000740 [Vicia faba]
MDSGGELQNGTSQHLLSALISEIEETLFCNTNSDEIKIQPIDSKRIKPVVKASLQSPAKSVSDWEKRGRGLRSGVTTSL